MNEGLIEQFVATLSSGLIKVNEPWYGLAVAVPDCERDVEKGVGAWQAPAGTRHIQHSNCCQITVFRKSALEIRFPMKPGKQ